MHCDLKFKQERILIKLSKLVIKCIKTIFFGKKYLEKMVPFLSHQCVRIRVGKGPAIAYLPPPPQNYFVIECISMTRFETEIYI